MATVTNKIAFSNRPHFGGVLSFSKEKYIGLYENTMTWLTVGNQDLHDRSPNRLQFLEWARRSLWKEMCVSMIFNHINAGHATNKRYVVYSPDPENDIYLIKSSLADIQGDPCVEPVIPDIDFRTGKDLSDAELYAGIVADITNPQVEGVFIRDMQYLLACPQNTEMLILQISGILIGAREHEKILPHVILAEDPPETPSMSTYVRTSLRQSGNRIKLCNAVALDPNIARVDLFLMPKGVLGGPVHVPMFTGSIVQFRL